MSLGSGNGIGKHSTYTELRAVTLVGEWISVMMFEQLPVVPELGGLAEAHLHMDLHQRRLESTRPAQDCSSRAMLVPPETFCLTREALGDLRDCPEICRSGEEASVAQHRQTRGLALWCLTTAREKRPSTVAALWSW
jgi:hypothetical protein